MNNTFACTCGRSKSPPIHRVMLTCQCNRIWKKVKFGHNHYRWIEQKPSRVEQMLADSGFSLEDIANRNK